MIRAAFWIGAFTFFLSVSVLLLIEKGHDLNEHEHTSSPVEKMIIDGNITELEILRKDLAGVESKTRIVLGGGSWQVFSFRDRLNASPASVDKEVALMTNARIDRCFPVAVGALQEYGLSAPVVTLKVAGPRSNQIIDFGSLTPDGFGRYIKLAGDREVCIVPRYHFENLIKLASLGSYLPDSEMK